MEKHIGLIGVSTGGCALAYQALCSEPNHPTVSTLTLPLSRYVDALNLEKLDESEGGGTEASNKAVRSLMEETAGKLESIGANILLCPDNTVHRSLSQKPPLAISGLNSKDTIFVHIADAVVEEVKRLGLKKVLLTGTLWLVNSPVYRSRFKKVTELGRGGDINADEGEEQKTYDNQNDDDDALLSSCELCIPSPEDAEFIHNMIMEELNGPKQICSLKSAMKFTQILDSFKREYHGDGVVLGCTELPLLYTKVGRAHYTAAGSAHVHPQPSEPEERNDLLCMIELLDSTRLVAMKALDHCKQ